MRRSLALLLATAAGLCLYAAVPSVVASHARAELASDPCTRGEGPPGESFFGAMDRLYLVQKLPGFRARAAEAAGLASAACTATFADACTGAAREGTRAALCGDWRRYIAWRRRQGTRIDELLECPPCKDEISSAAP